MKASLYWTLLVLSALLSVSIFAQQTDANDASSTSTTTSTSNECQGSDDETCQAVFAPLGEPSEYMESSQAGIRLAVRRWEPMNADAIKSVLVVHHGGVGWHSGFFDVLGKALVEKGIATIAYDQVGSGYSDSMNGFRQYFDSMDTLDADLSKVVAATKTKYNKPVFCLGESFGGMVLLYHMLREPNASGYILTGPVIRIRKEMLPPKIVQRIIKFLAMFFPHLKMPGTDFMTTFDEAFGDPRWAAAGRADPFIQEAASTPPRLGMAASVISASDTIWENKQEVHVPFAIFMGEKDVRVYIPDSEALYEEAKSTDKTLKIVEGGHHQLFQDAPQVTQSVVDGVGDWILARS